MGYADTNSNVIANGVGSVAIGHDVTATKDYSTALGDGSKAYGTNSLAALGGTTGTGEVGVDKDNGGNIIDTSSVADKGKGAIAIGEKAVAEKDYTYAIGKGAEAKEDNTIAIGNGSKATGEKAIAIGSGNEVSGKGSGAFGDPNYVYANNSYAIGNDNIIGVAGSLTTGVNSFVLGNNIKTTNDNTVVIGHHTESTKDTNTYGENSVSLGFDAVSTLADSVALGSGALASAKGGYTTTGTDDVTIGNLKLSSSSFAGTGDSVIGTVSVGQAGKLRTLTNVGAGQISSTSTDAINGSQLYSAIVASQFKLLSGENITVTEGTEEGTGIKTYTISSSNATAVSNGTNVGVTKATTSDSSSSSGGSSSTGTGTGSSTTSSGTYYTDTYTVNAADSKVDSVKVEAGTATTTGNTTTTNYTVSVTSKEQSVEEDGSIKTQDVTKSGTFAVTDKDTYVKGSSVSSSTDTSTGVTTHTVRLTDNTGTTMTSFNVTDKDTRNTVEAGDNITVGSETQADGSLKYTVSLNKQVDLSDSGSVTVGNTKVENNKVTVGDTVITNNSVQTGTVNATTVNATTVKAGNTTINTSGMTIQGGPTITNSNVDMAGQQIHNVKAGTAAMDAVNVSQLKQTEANFDQKLNHLNGRIGEVAQDANAGIAMALAAASLPQAYLPGKSMMAIAAGTYRGEQGYAVGFSHVTQGGIVLKANASGNSQGHYGAAVGAGIMW